MIRKVNEKMTNQKCDTSKVDGPAWDHYMWPRTDQEELLNFLREHNLMKYAKRLQLEGVHNLRDLAKLNHEDLKSIGFGEGCLKARKTILNYKCKFNEGDSFKCNQFPIF